MSLLVSEALVGSGNSAGCHFSCSGNFHGSCKNIELKAFPFLFARLIPFLLSVSLSRIGQIIPRASSGQADSRLHVSGPAAVCLYLHGRGASVGSVTEESGLLTHSANLSLLPMT